MGGHDEKLNKFWKIEKKIGDLYELDNFNVVFRPIFNKSEIFFDRSRKSNAVFRN